MIAAAESSLEEYNLGEGVHPYMCLYDAILDPTICIYDSDEDSTESSQEDDSGDLIRTSPLQKYAVRYATRIYNVLSEDNRINGDKSGIQSSPPKHTFTNNLPRINVPSHSSVVSKKVSDNRISPSQKKKELKSKQATGTKLKKPLSSPGDGLNKKPNESKVDESNKTPEKQMAPTNTGRPDPKRGRAGSDFSASATQSEKKAKKPKQMGAKDDTDTPDDDMRRYPKRKRVSSDFSISEASLSSNSEAYQPKEEEIESGNDDDSAMERRRESEDFKPKDKRKKRIRKHRPYKPLAELYPEGRYKDVEYDEIAKETPNEDYSKDVVTDHCEDHDARWNRNFRKLHAFYRKHGTFLFPTKKGTPKHPLSRFATRQRRSLALKTLHPDRFRRLNSINFDWDPHKDMGWEVRFEELAEFKKKNGHTNVKVREKGKTKLGNWCRKQRYRYLHTPTMEQEKIDRLESIGFRWIIRPEKTLKKVCQELEGFYEDNKHYRVPPDYPNNLGRRAQLLREQYARKTLPKDEEDMLNVIGFDFSLGKTIKKSTSKK